MSDSDAIAAITRVLERNDDADPEVTARHILTTLAGLGYRHVVHPPPPPAAPAPPTAEYVARKAAIQRST